MKKFPQNLKYKKYFKTKLKQKNKYKLNLSLLRSSIGSQAIETGKLTPEQIESGRVSIRRKMGRKKKKIKLWIKVFPYISYTRKPVGMRMGKGKGVRAGWFYPVSIGNFLYELNYKHNSYVFRLIRSYSNSRKKLSVKTKVYVNVY